MSIQNELSAEIAVALLSRANDPERLNDLKEVILKVHSILQETTKHQDTDDVPETGEAHDRARNAWPSS